MGFFDIFKKKKDPDFGNIDTGLGLGGNLGLDANAGSDPLSMHTDMAMREHNLDTGMGMNPAANLSNAGMGQSSGMQGMQSYSNYGSQGGSSGIEKDLQILSLKLDAIKSEIDSMNQRIKNIEMIAEKEQNPQQKRWY